MGTHATFHHVRRRVFPSTGPGLLAPGVVYRLGRTKDSVLGAILAANGGVRIGLEIPHKKQRPGRMNE